MIIFSDGAFNKHTVPNAWASVVDKDECDIIGKHFAKFQSYLDTLHANFLSTFETASASEKTSASKKTSANTQAKSKDLFHFARVSLKETSLSKNEQEASASENAQVKNQDLSDFKLKIEKHNLFKTKKEQTRHVIICKFSDCKMQNNGAELVSFMLGLYYFTSLHIKEPKEEKQMELFTDSSLILDFWSKSLSLKKISAMDPFKCFLVRETQRLRKIFESRGGKVSKVSGDGNIADLGAH